MHYVAPEVLANYRRSVYDGMKVGPAGDPSTAANCGAGGSCIMGGGRQWYASC